MGRGNRNKPYDGLVEELAELSSIKAAARLGELWGTNPLELLDVDDHDWLILVACAEVVAADREEERKRMQSESDLPSV